MPRGLAPSLVLLLATLGSWGAAAADVVGCGGFVQASKELSQLRKASGSKIDFSTITVEIQNKEGLVKEKAHCAPNGYFFVPVYDQGKYFVSIQGPDGWTFEPQKVEVIVDDKTCNGGKDLHFVHAGFSLSGRVLGARGVGPACDTGAPAGVQVSLSGEGLEAPRVATTDATGSYAFHNLSPGTYELGASHPKWRIETLDTPKVELSWDNARVPDFLRVAGYDLTGSVVSQGQPVPGLTVFLFSQRLKKLAVCPGGLGSTPGGAPLPSPLPGRQPLCAAVTDALGRFSFPELFCGDYELAAHPRLAGELHYEVAPEVMAVSVGHASATLQEPFTVLGFSIGGTVEDSVGAGVPEADVFLNGKLVTKTDAKGHYTLAKMTAGQYRLSASKPHYYFQELEAVELGAGVLQLPPVVAQTYDVCAQVELSPGAKVERKRRVTLSPVDGAGGAAPQAKVTDDKGSVCFQVAPGQYELVPHRSQAEVEAGLLFDPPLIVAHLIARPLTLNSFKQTHLSVSGRVECIEACDGRERVTLAYLGPAPSGSAQPQAAKRPMGGDGENRTQLLDPRTESFVFENVPAGRYLLTVFKETRPVEPTKNAVTLDADEWCWEGEGAIELELRDASAQGLVLRQSGFRLVVNSTVDDVADVAFEEGAMKMQIVKGRQEFCLEKPGEYQLYFMEGCFYYGWLSFSWNTVVPFKALFDPKWYLIKGWAYVDSRGIPWANNISDSVMAPIFYPDGIQQDGTYYMHPEQPANASQPILGLQWKYFGNPHEEAYVEPTHNGDISPEFKTVEDYQREMMEEEARKHEAQKALLRQHGVSEAQIQELEQKLLAGGGEGADLLHLAGMGHLAGAPEGQEGGEGAEGEGEGEGAGGAGAVEASFVHAKVPLLKEEAERKREAERQRALEAEKEEEHGEEEGKEEGKEGGDAEGEGEKGDGGEEEEGANGEEEEEEGGNGDEDEEDLVDEAPPPREPKPFPSTSIVLFYPKRRHFKLPIYECAPEPEPFVGRLAQYLRGRIEPPISGVNVTAVADSDSLAAEFKAGEVVEWGESREGEYLVGPLYDDATYHVELEKEGFIFKALGEGRFAAQQLASIKVSLSGTPRARARGEGTASALSVLLSLTGDGSFVRNAPVRPGDNHTFLGLDPGAYFLRPLLKEYRFEPPAHALDLQSGEQLAVHFSATRVAYGVSGRVLSLTGEREEGVTVEARTKEGAATAKHYETAVTNSKGVYRLRGLVPGVEYSIQVLIKGKAPAGSSQGAEAKYERASPKTRDVVIGNADLEDFDFVVFDQAPSLLTGTVSVPGGGEWRKHITVEVVDASNTGVVVRSSPLPVSRFFEFRDLPAGRYLVRLASGLPEKKFSFVGDEAAADLRAERTVHVGNLKFQVKKQRGAQQCVVGADGSKQCTW